MFNCIRSLLKMRCLVLLLPLALLCVGCSSQASPPTDVFQASPTPTATAQQGFASYVGKWEVHDSLLTIQTNKTGLEQWNAGPCSGQMCNGNAQITFVEKADGSIQGTIQFVSYSQWNGDPAPTGFQPGVDDPQAGDTFQLQHSGSHLLYTTWLGAKASSLNSGNRYWCDSYAVKSGWKQCGA